MFVVWRSVLTCSVTKWCYFQLVFICYSATCFIPSPLMNTVLFTYRQKLFSQSFSIFVWHRKPARRATETLDIVFIIIMIIIILKEYSF